MPGSRPVQVASPVAALEIPPVPAPAPVAPKPAVEAPVQASRPALEAPARASRPAAGLVAEEPAPRTSLLSPAAPSTPPRPVSPVALFDQSVGPAIPAELSVEAVGEGAQQMEAPFDDSADASDASEDILAVGGPDDSLIDEPDAARFSGASSLEEAVRRSEPPAEEVDDDDVLLDDDPLDASADEPEFSTAVVDIRRGGTPQPRKTLDEKLKRLKDGD